MGKWAVVSIVTRDFLPWARSLAASIAVHSPETHVYVCLADRPEPPFDAGNEPFTVFFADELGIPNWRRFAFQYTPFELCCALKPWALDHIGLCSDAQMLVYLDADTQVYAPLPELIGNTDDPAILLSPHFRSPEEGCGRENQTRMGGVYNAGFLGLHRSNEAQAFLSWWKSRLAKGCILNARAGVSADQSWLDYVPCYFKNALVLDHPGINVAYWNLRHRSVTGNAQAGYRAENVPLVFFHFSGYSPLRPEYLSRFVPDLRVSAQSPAMQSMVDEYRQRLMATGFEQFRTQSCAYGRLSDGTSVRRTWRHAILADHPLVEGIADPFDVNGTADLVKRLERAAREVAPDPADLWRYNYWRLAHSFPVNSLLWIRRRLLRIADPEDAP